MGGKKKYIEMFGSFTEHSIRWAQSQRLTMQSIVLSVWLKKI